MVVGKVVRCPYRLALRSADVSVCCTAVGVLCGPRVYTLPYFSLNNLLITALSFILVDD